MPMEQEIGCWDSVLLENLTEENFINNLQQRFKRDNIYTYIGTYLVSLNPYKPLAIYSSEQIERYGRRSLFHLPPHIYAITNLAYQGLQDYNEDQCVILSGESGSGKTEASRIMVHFLTEVSQIKTRMKSTPNKYRKYFSNGSNPEIYPILSKGCIKTESLIGNNVRKCSREKSVEFDFSHHKSVENLSSKCITHPLTLNSNISKSIEGKDSLVNLSKKCSKHCGNSSGSKTTEFHNKLFNNYNETNCIDSCPQGYAFHKNILKDNDGLVQPQSSCNRINSFKTISYDEQSQHNQKSGSSKQCCLKNMCTLPSKFKLSASSSSASSNKKSTFLSDSYCSGLQKNVPKLKNNANTCEMDANKMRERVAQAEIFLEAMGNAETMKNSNSSRFGRFFDVEFDFKGDPISGHLTHYMLEKSRVTRTNQNERNFHIFYQLLSGADIHLLKSLKLQRNVDKYELLKYGTVNEEDKLKFPFTFNSLEHLGLYPDEISAIFKIIAVVLKLGNLVFMSTTNIDGTEGTDISNDYELHEISQLLGIDERLLFNCLTKSGINWNHLDNGAELDAKNASSYRYILCRTLYGRLFTWVVNRINESLKFKQYRRGRNLGILDFYGFEILENNSYEQLVVNYCNERFQQHFVQFVLKYQQDLYNREGLDWIKIDYFDNLTICELIDRPNHGIMSLLDEPQVTCNETFSTRLNQCCSGHTSFLIQDSNIKNSSFQIRHYAGPVTYSTIGFIEKNLDNLPKHISSCLYQCRLSIVQSLFPEGNPKKSTKKPNTLSNSIRTSLQSLLSLIENRKSHYVFCIKPNERKQSKLFELALIQHQVRYLSLLPLAQLWRTGHYFNMSHNKFLNRYKLLSHLTWPHYNKDNVVESIAFIIRSIPLPAAEFTIGRKNVFIRSPRTVYELEEFRKSRLDYLAVLIQKTFRCYYQRKHFLRMKKSQILIASAWKMWRECRFGISFRGKKHLWGLYKVAREEYRLVKYRKQVEWAVGVLQRHHIQWQKKQFLLTLMLRLPENCSSPLCIEWPTAPRFLAETSQLLRNIYHRWRCHTYRKKFDQTSRNRMREKVTASIIFKDRKSSYARSVSHPFIGDYVRLRQNVQWKKICVENNDQYVVFADIINKITRSSGKFVPILLVLSTSSMLLLDQRTLQIKYRVPAAEIYRMSLSPYLDDIAVFHIKASEYGKKKGDFVFQTGHVIEIVTKLFLVIQNATSKPPEVHISTEFEANFGQQTVVFTFKCGGVAELTHGQARVSRKGNRMEVIV